jgi:hypothetical protein
LLALTSQFAIACKEKAYDYVVQIWQPAASNEPATLMAYGVIVDDGNHVLTVLDYENYTPDRLLVISPEHGTFDASIQAIDYRTSATLLKLNNANLRSAQIGDSLSLKSDQKEFMKTPANINISDNISPLFFSVSIPQDFLLRREGWVDESGAPITDKNDKVVGLLGRYSSKLIIKLGGIPGQVYLPLAVNINVAQELLTNPSQLKESGGLDIVPSNPPHLPINNIKNLDTAIMGLLNKLGKPLPPDDLLGYSLGLPRGFRPEEGIMLVSVFPYSVELRDNGNNLLTSAKWIGIQWGRDEGKPNRLIYGDTAYQVDGAYSIEGDIAGLEQMIEPIINF